jgi:hypothetical protein
MTEVALRDEVRSGTDVLRAIVRRRARGKRYYNVGEFEEHRPATSEKARLFFPARAVQCFF